MTTPTDDEVLAAWQTVVSTAEAAAADAQAANVEAALAASQARDALRALMFPEAQ